MLPSIPSYYKGEIKNLDQIRDSLKLLVFSIYFKWLVTGLLDYPEFPELLLRVLASSWGM